MGYSHVATEVQKRTLEQWYRFEHHHKTDVDATVEVVEIARKGVSLSKRRAYKKLTRNDAAFKEIKWYRSVRIKCENHSPITFCGDNLC